MSRKNVRGAIIRCNSICPRIFCFDGLQCKQAMTKFILFVNLDMADTNSAPEEFACV